MRSKLSHMARALPPCAILAFCVLTSIESRNARPGAVLFTLSYLIAGVAWAAAGWMESKRPGTYSLLWIIVVAAVARAITLPFGPLFDNDIYRYLWDGHVAAHGINPFMYPPDSQALASVRTGYFGQIGYPGIGTIYPPAAQMIFLSAAKLHLVTPTLFKLVLVPFDVGCGLLIAALLGRTNGPRGMVLLYAWSPLILKEFYNSGHVDIVMMCLMLLAVHLVLLGRRALGGAALALSFMTKGASLILLPVLSRRGWLPVVLASVMVACVLWLPYSSAGSRALGGASAYAHYWRFNDGAFYVLCEIDNAFGGRNDPTAPYAKMAALALIAGYLVLAARQAGKGTEGILRACGNTIMAMLLLSPVVDPWYVCWLIPFVCLLRGRGAIALCILCVLSYTYYDNNTFPAWVRAAEYVPVYALLMYDAVNSRRQLYEIHRVR